MPKIKCIEDKIYSIEGVKVNILNMDGTNVREDKYIDANNYSVINRTKNFATVSYLINKLKKHFSGYEFEILNGLGEKARGNMLLKNIRNTYLEYDT